MKYFIHEKKQKITYFDDKTERFQQKELQYFIQKYKNCIETHKRFNTGIDGFGLMENIHGELIPYSPGTIGFQTYFKKKFNYTKMCYGYFKHACAMVKSNDSLDTFRMYYNHAPYAGHEKSNKMNMKYPKDENGEMLPYIVGCKQIQIERDCENQKKNTFDFVRVIYSMSSKIPQKELIENIKKDYKLIANAAVKRLAISKRYQHYNVPVNFLKISKCTLTADRLLEFTFELKEIPTSHSAPPKTNET